MGYLFPPFESKKQTDTHELRTYGSAPIDRSKWLVTIDPDISLRYAHTMEILLFTLIEQS